MMDSISNIDSQLEAIKKKPLIVNDEKIANHIDQNLGNKVTNQVSSMLDTKLQSNELTMTQLRETAHKIKHAQDALEERIGNVNQSNKLTTEKLKHFTSVALVGSGVLALVAIYLLFVSKYWNCAFLTTIITKSVETMNLHATWAHIVGVIEWIVSMIVAFTPPVIIPLYFWFEWGRDTLM